MTKGKIMAIPFLPYDRHEARTQKPLGVSTAPRSTCVPFYAMAQPADLLCADVIDDPARRNT